MMNNNAAKLVQQIFDALSANQVFVSAAAGRKTTNCYYRNNPDGTIRWVWPCSAQRPLFLKFYNTATFRAKCVAFIIHLLFKLKLRGLFASGKIECPFNTEEGEWALFTGTEGVNRTAVLYAASVFYKIPLSDAAAVITANEYQHLKRLNKHPFNNIITPKCLLHTQILQLEDVGHNSTRSSRFTPLHWQAIGELAPVFFQPRKIYKLNGWELLDEQLAALSVLSGNRIPKELVNKLILLKDRINEHTVAPSALAHGDFTPWNLFIKNGKLAVIDWELAQPAMPLLFDVFHFLYQQASLGNPTGFKQLAATIEHTFQQPEAKAFIEQHNIDVALHHQLYLLLNITHYLRLYAQQPHWPAQVYLSLNMWNHALSHVLAATGARTGRQLLLTGIFSWLSDKQYAALKWTATGPETLSEDSDADLCIAQKDTRALIQWLRENPLVKKINIQRRSFMYRLFIVTHSNELLAIDCIHRFKRRALVMLNAEELLQTATVNVFGVKVPSPEMDFSYTWLFYLLNKSSLPEKYQKYFDYKSREMNRHMKLNFSWNPVLHTHSYKELFHYNREHHKTALRHLTALPENRGWQAIKNRLQYVADTIKEQYRRPGFTITFSGVDGAGKTTIITNVKKLVEKRYRRKVVVLRHRPAMLPMLSAWREGSRKAAEQKAASVLPRQGKNKSTLLSLFRFGYYYTDYLVGQFIVFFKYILRGYVVLYDRYYFDFIHDGKRSNIQLPVNWVKWGYRLLLKPRYNFFLFADAQEILKRKQELDGETIRSLTRNYRTHFRQLEKQYNHSHYISIENKNIAQTIGAINRHVQQSVLA